MKTRHTARLILLNTENKIYLMKIKPSNVTEKHSVNKQAFWVTAGGEIEPHETVEAALRRELYEETGMTDVTIYQPAAWYGEIILNCDGEDVLFCENFFVATVENDSISHEGLMDHEREVLCDHKWWGIEELKKSKEIFVPKKLPELLNEILGNRDGPIKTRSINLSIN